MLLVRLYNVWAGDHLLQWESRDPAILNFSRCAPLQYLWFCLGKNLEFRGWSKAKVVARTYADNIANCIAPKFRLPPITLIEILDWSIENSRTVKIPTVVPPRKNEFKTVSLNFPLETTLRFFSNFVRRCFSLGSTICERSIILCNGNPEIQRF